MSENIARVQYREHLVELNTHGNKDIYISTNLCKGEIWEPHLTEIWYNHINENDLVIDIGANIGWYTKIDNLKNAVSIAIEPDPKNFNLLVENCSINNELHNICAGKSFEDLLLSLSDDNFGDNCVSSDGTILCKQNTIDNIIGDRANRVRAIKIDTQGYEVPIILGAIETLKKVSDDCLIIIEYYPYALYKAGYNYDCYNVLFDIFQGQSNFIPTIEIWEQNKNNNQYFTDIVLQKK